MAGIFAVLKEQMIRDTEILRSRAFRRIIYKTTIMATEKEFVVSLNKLVLPS
jgi:hypothetical protein